VAWAANLGAVYLGEGRCRFQVWAPAASRVEVHIIFPREIFAPLTKDDCGYHQAIIEGVAAGSRYRYRLDGGAELPDPASRAQPEGIGGPSQVMATDFHWGDGGWWGRSLEEYIIYELHVGTFSREGTFAGVIGHLDELVELGITAIELMPVAQFPGGRNWGYDGVFPFATQNSYGGPEGLWRLVDASHQKGLAVILDVVYNHLGPEGNHLAEFGPYFTDRYHTPWGAALNFDGPASDEVRRYFIENALYWLTEFHIDALRLDALHAIADNTPYTFIEELADVFHKQASKLGRQAYLIGESAANDAKLIRERARGGYGLDAQWNDDFHHALHTLLTGERAGYYQDFGELSQLAKALREGFPYSGEYSAYRQRRHGVSSRDIPAQRFVVFSQNHDQIGNRAQGDRLSTLIPSDRLRLAAGLVILAPYLPLLFMGEEYGETALFPYFVSHTDPELVAAVRRGRREEFAAFGEAGEIPDPQDVATFNRAKLDHERSREGNPQRLWELYRELLRLRREIPALARPSKNGLAVGEMAMESVIYFHRRCEDSEAFVTASFADVPQTVSLPLPEGRWRPALATMDKRWGGSEEGLSEIIASGDAATLRLEPWSLLLFIKEN